MWKVDVAWNQARAFEEHAQAAEGDEKKTAFQKLRDFWIRTGNAAHFEEHMRQESHQSKEGRQTIK